MWAARNGRTETVKALLKSEACTTDVLMAKDNHHGRTALMWATLKGHTETVEALLESKYCTSEVLLAKDNDGNTAERLALKKGNSTLAKLLQRQRVYYALLGSAKNYDDKVIAMLNDYCKGTISVLSKLSVFSHGHFNRHHTDIVQNLVSQYKSEALDIKGVLKKLDEIKNKNPNGA